MSCIIMLYSLFYLESIRNANNQLACTFDSSALETNYGDLLPYGFPLSWLFTVSMLANGSPMVYNRRLPNIKDSY
jgi:hypothetical protein